MHLKKDSKKSKAILVIDVILALLALAGLACCGYLLFALSALPDSALMDADIRAKQEEISQLEVRIQGKTDLVARAEAEGLTALEAAQTELEAVRVLWEAVSEEHAGLKAQAERIENAEVLQNQLREDIARIRTEYGEACRTLEDMILAGETDYKICYLTFDDGPSYPTPEFLDLIDALDIRVTFFTIGVQMGEHGQELRDKLMRREALGGHSLANHTYTHGIYDNLYQNLNIFMDAVKRQDELVYSVTGIKPDIFRFPAGSYYCPFREDAIAALDEIGYGWIDWIANAYDSGPQKESDSIMNNILWQVHQDDITVVLMHDWRYDTLGALERIVKTLKQDNYLFLPLFRESSTINAAKPRWG
jgi:peptidoglycan/xylan/chitin deacetylase (PgdA/CDA1 family)